MANDQVVGGAQDLVAAGQLLQSETAQIQAMNAPPSEKAKKLDQSFKKYANSLRNHGVQQSTIDAYGALISKMPEQANLLVTALTDLTKSQLQSVLDLQKKQADLAMAKSDRLADATTGIASFATIVSTIARYLGFDDFAETVEAKTKDIMSRVKIGLNTDGIGNGLDAGINNLRTNSVALWKANADSVGQTAQAVANGAPMDVPTAANPFVVGAANAESAPATGSKPVAPQTPKGVSWNSIQESLTKEGASAADQTKVKKLFADAADKTGDVATIDSTKETAALLKAIKAESALNKYVPAIKTVVEREMHITGNT